MAELTKELSAKMYNEYVAFAKSMNEKYGMNGGVKVTWASDHMVVKIQHNVVESDGTDLTLKNAFIQYCHMYGLSPAMYGAKIKMNGNKLGTIVGLKTGNHKMPIIIEFEGKRFKVTPEQALVMYNLANK